MEESMEQTIRKVEPKPRNWLVILDYIFYVVLIAAVAGFIYYLYTYRDIISLYLPYLLQAAGVTIGISVVSAILAIIFGFIGAMCRLSRFAPLRWIATVYVEVVRGTPILVQLLFWYFRIGQLLPNLGFDPSNVALQCLTLLHANSLVRVAFSAYSYGVIVQSFITG